MSALTQNVVKNIDTFLYDWVHLNVKEVSNILEHVLLLKIPYLTWFVPLLRDNRTKQLKIPHLNHNSSLLKVVIVRWRPRATSGFNFCIYSCALHVLYSSVSGKNPIFLKTQNKHLHWLYSSEILDIKALEYKKYFTHIDLWRTLKNSQVIHAIVETKFWMFGQVVSKYMIVSVCVMLWRHSIPRWKGYFIRISMVFFVLKWVNTRWDIYVINNWFVKSSKCRLSIKSKDTIWSLVFRQTLN
jgi:hypothetical protein